MKTPRTQVEEAFHAVAVAADADGGHEERELHLLLRAHKRYDRVARADTVLLPAAAFRRALRLSRIVDGRRGLPKHETIRRLTEAVTGRRVE